MMRSWSSKPCSSGSIPQGMTPMEATKSAIADVSGPVIAIALVLAAVFVPVAFLGGLTGQLYKQFALTLAVSVVLSAICALTFTPAMCALLLKPVKAAHPRHGPLGCSSPSSMRAFERSRDGYVRAVSVMQRHAVVVMLTFGVLLVAVWGLIATRPTGLVPPEDQGYSSGGEPAAGRIARADQRCHVGDHPYRARGPRCRGRRIHQRLQFADQSVSFLQRDRFPATQAVG